MRPQPIQQYRDHYKLEKREHLIKKVLVVCLVCSAILIGLAYLFFFSGLFEIKTVEFKSKSPKTLGVNAWLDEKDFFIKRRSSIVFLSLNKLKQYLIENHPELESIDIKKEYFKALVVSFTERTPVGIWCQIDQCYYFDKNFIAYAEAPETTGFLVLNIKDLRVRKIKLGEKIDDRQWLDKIILTNESLTKNKFVINYFEIPQDSFDQFDAITHSSYKILFSIDTDVE